MCPPPTRLDQSPIPFLADISKLLTGKLDFSAVNSTHFWDVTWTFIFVEMFDSFGTLSTIMMKSGIGAGNVRKADRAINNAMLIDSWGLLFGALVSAEPPRLCAHIPNAGPCPWSFWSVTRFVSIAKGDPQSKGDP